MILNNIRSLRSKLNNCSIISSIFLNNNYSMENKINIFTITNTNTNTNNNTNNNNNININININIETDNIFNNNNNNNIININFNNNIVNNNQNQDENIDNENKLIKRNKSQYFPHLYYNIPDDNKIYSFEKFNGYIKTYQKNLIYYKNKDFNEFCKSESLYMLKKDLNYIRGNSDCLINFIGYGTYYYKVIDRNKKEYFCKIVNDKRLEYFTIDEIKNNYKLSNLENIAKLTDAYCQQVKSSYSNIYYIFTEYYKNGELFKFLYDKKVNRSNVYKFMKQIIDSIYTCHKHGISHRDLKLENYVIDKYYNLKLIDFGFSTTAITDNTACGTTMYVSPELSAGKVYDCKKNDIYSLGIMLYVLVYFSFPKFKANHNIFSKKAKIHDEILKYRVNQLLQNIFIEESLRVDIDEIKNSYLYEYLIEKINEV